MACSTGPGDQRLESNEGSRLSCDPYNSPPRPPTSPPFWSARCFSFFVFLCVVPVELTNDWREGWGRGVPGAKLLENSWSSINHSILSDVGLTNLHQAERWGIQMSSRFLQLYVDDNSIRGWLEVFVETKIASIFACPRYETYMKKWEEKFGLSFYEQFC